MLSEKQHIDDFFRKKEDAFNPDVPFINEHWQQLKEQLAVPATVISPGKKTTHFKRHLVKYLGGFVLVTIITILTINPVRYVKKTTASKTTQAATDAVAAKSLLAKSIIKPVAASVTAMPAKRKRVSLSMAHIKSTAKPVPAKQPAAPVEEKTATEQTTYKPDAFELLNAFYRQLQNEEQEFTIAANRDTTLTASAGTRLVIAANSFTGKQGMIKKKEG